MVKTVDSHCPAFQLAADVLARPWSALILNVLQAGPLGFCQLAERASGPGDKVLSARLKELESRGLIARHVEPGPPIRVAYELTECGRAFSHVAESMWRWGDALLSQSPKAQGAKKVRARGKRA